MHFIKFLFAPRFTSEGPHLLSHTMSTITYLKLVLHPFLLGISQQI